MFGLPTTEGLHRLLQAAAGKRAYIIELRYRDGRLMANNGDHLMYRVFLRILEELRIESVNSPEGADVLILPPSGSLLQTYSFPQIFRERLEQLPDLPLFIFPSSALFPTMDPSLLFGQRSSETVWILREQPSRDHLSEKWGPSLALHGVILSLDHDVVASGHKYVSEILGGGGPGKTRLVAARGDLEASIEGLRAGGVQGRHSPSTVAGAAVRALQALPYGPWTTLAGRVARRSKQARAAERLLCLSDGQVQGLRQAGLKTVSSDISAVQYATFREYCVELRRAAVVVTNRLHVALPAAVLGKQVVMIEAGYHKLWGVYSQSLSSLVNVKFVSGATTIELGDLNADDITGRR